MLTLIGPGFLGSHVRARWLAAHGGGAPEPLLLVGRKPPLQAPLAHETFMLADDFAGAAGDAALAQSRAVLYLASTSTVATYVQQPWLEFPDNVAPVLQLCTRIARHGRDAKLVFASSGGAIYGAVQGTAAIPEDFPCAPISPYGLGKLCAEQAIAYAGRTMGLSYNILRIANPVGRFAHSRLQGLVSVAMNAIDTGEPVTLFGDGSHVRDLVDADDVADAIIAATGADHLRAHVWNIGSGVGMSNVEVLDMVARAVGRPVPVRHVAPRPQDVQSIVLDCRRVADDLGWQPVRVLAETAGKLWQSRINVVAPSLHE